MTLDDVFVCPHGPDEACPCRKPRPGLVLAAAERWGFNSAKCFVIGDKASDIGLGKTVGAVTMLVGDAASNSRSESEPDFVVSDLLEAASAIERILKYQSEPFVGTEKTVSSL